jgi:hypothetical protein
MYPGERKEPDYSKDYKHANKKYKKKKKNEKKTKVVKWPQRGDLVPSIDAPDISDIIDSDASEVINPLETSLESENVILSEIINKLRDI